MGRRSLRRLRGRQNNSEHLTQQEQQWRFRFYCWWQVVFLVPATAQAVEIVVALAEGRTPQLIRVGP